MLPKEFKTNLPVLYVNVYIKKLSKYADNQQQGFVLMSISSNYLF